MSSDSLALGVDGERPQLTLDTDGPRIVGSRVRYPQTYAEYAVTYHHGERTVKRWVADGREVKPAPDLPPLHRPTEMPAWFQRRYPHRSVPPELIDAAREHTLPPPPSPASDTSGAQKHSAEIVPPAPSPEPPSEPRNFDHIKALGIEENVEHLRRQLAINAELVEEAQRGTDQSLLASRQKAYREIFAELRKAEADLVEWKIRTGDYVPKAEVRAENNRIASTVFNAVLRLVKNVRPQLTGKSDAEQDRIWLTETLACFGVLKGAKFTTFDPLAA